jgi:hypothetical protein
MNVPFILRNADLHSINPILKKVQAVPIFLSYFASTRNMQ